ncbi:hypothetical protein KEM09_12085 [Carboxylicivirga mesophila]|uniref:Phage tail protein n=1 Tax=Carboxylicivirga mesophila TaxID=1166478 RepID=A0ABS5KB11_9BACT|nr:hypothetical protein [Carboxylicivirga mesophila]MBS2212149.1 hypothetical protein [Carboxylicivirga mesophila]
MKIKSFTGQSEIDGLRVHKPIMGIVVKANTALANETIEIKRLNSATGENESICARTPIITMGEISSQLEGFMSIAAGDSLAVVLIANGGLKLDTDKYLEIEMGSLDGTKQYDIYGLEENNLTDKAFKYERFTIPAGEDLKKYGVMDSDLLALPVTGLVNLKVWANDNVTMEYSPVELQAIANLENDIVKVGTTVKYGYDKYYLVSISDIKELEIETNGNTYQFFMIDKI